MRLLLVVFRSDGVVIFEGICLCHIRTMGASLANPVVRQGWIDGWPTSSAIRGRRFRKGRL